jgi:hypothetical protein
MLDDGFDKRTTQRELGMTFDQWIDSVNAELHGRMGAAVRTEELSWDSAMWVGAGGTVVAALADDESTVAISYDGGRIALPYRDTPVLVASDTIAARLAGRS